MKNTVLKFGLIGGLIISAFMWSTMPFMDKNTDMGNSEILGYAAMILSFSTIFIGIYQYRNKELGGKISFGKAFQMGLLISLLISTLYVISWMFLSAFFLPEFGDVYLNSMIESYKNSGMSEAEIQIQIESMESWMEMYKNPIFKFFFTYIEILPLGALLSLIAAAIYKRK